MPRRPKLSKTVITERLTAVFERNGYAGASLQMLADAAELSKASLYHHFPRGKEDMAAHVLGQAGVRLQSQVLAPLMGALAAEDRLRLSLEGAASYYCGKVPVCLMNSLLLGADSALFGSQIKSAVEVWQQGLEKAYAEVGADKYEAKAWAAYAIERIQGALVVCRVKATRMPLETCLSELKADVDAIAE